MNHHDVPIFAPPSGVDQRGFLDALLPLRRKYEWQMERYQMELVAAHSALADVKLQLELTKQDQLKQADILSRGLQTGFNAFGYQKGLTYLVGHHNRVEELSTRVDSCRSTLDRVRSDIATLQKRIEGLARHREASWIDYCGDALRQISVEQDRAWLASMGRQVKGNF